MLKIVVATLLAGVSTLITATNIKDYHPIFKCISNNYIVAIREFKRDNIDSLLVVDANSLKSYIIDAKELGVSRENCNNIFKKPNRYLSLLKYSISNPKHPLQNDGITHFKSGLYLTTDLCPSSKKGYEHRLYKALIDNFKNPTPVTIFITKWWIDSHKNEFKELKKWRIEHKLDITWGNHTAKHIYHLKVPLKENFVLSKEENLKEDILDLEIKLIENNETPSIFFRFPGLVSDKKSIESAYNLGLITIGSDSWLAKGEKPKEGSIILVHGNKNEQKGVDILINMIKDKNITNLSDLKSASANLNHNL